MNTNHFISPVGPDFSIPYYSNDSTDSLHIPEPPLFGEEQFKDGFGPVYATPTYPWNPAGMQNQNTGYNSVQQTPVQSMDAMYRPRSCCCAQRMKTYYIYPYCMYPSFTNYHYQ